MVLDDRKVELFDNAQEVRATCGCHRHAQRILDRALNIDGREMRLAVRSFHGVGPHAAFD